MEDKTAGLPKDNAFGMPGFFIYHTTNNKMKEKIMKNAGFIRASIYILVSVTLALTSCGGDRGGSPPRNTGVGQARQVSGVNGRTAVLRTISITPSDTLGINSGTQLQFAATGSYSDNSLKDLTTMVIWTSSDTSIATISNEPGLIGLATTISRGYCSISATLGGISGSTIIGVN